MAKSKLKMNKVLHRLLEKTFFGIGRQKHRRDRTFLRKKLSKLGWGHLNFRLKSRKDLGLLLLSHKDLRILNSLWLNQIFEEQLWVLYWPKKSLELNFQVLTIKATNYSNVAAMEKSSNNLTYSKHFCVKNLKIKKSRLTQ